MKNIKINTRNIIHITPNQLIDEVNLKCFKKLGYEVIKDIYQTVNNKIRVVFFNKKILNFSSFIQACEHLNVAYNLKLSTTLKEHITVAETDIEDVSNIDTAKNDLKTMIVSFQSNKDKLNLNMIILSDYFESTQWEKFNFNKKETDEVIDYLSNCNEITSRRYLTIISNLIYKAK